MVVALVTHPLLADLLPSAQIHGPRAAVLFGEAIVTVRSVAYMGTQQINKDSTHPTYKVATRPAVQFLSPCAELLQAPHALVRALVQHPADMTPRTVLLCANVHAADLDLLVSQDNHRWL